MADAGGDGKQVTGVEFDGAVFEVDDKDAFEDEKGFVRIGVCVPIEWLRHHADVDVVVVDGREDTIQVAALRFARDGVAIDGLDHFVMRPFFVFDNRVGVFIFGIEDTDLILLAGMVIFSIGSGNFAFWLWAVAGGFSEITCTPNSFVNLADFVG